MVLKRLGKRGTKKKPSAKGRVSVAKLSNKRLNKLAKQGKLKSKSKPDRKRLLQLINERVNPDQQRHLQAAAGFTRDEEPTDIPLEEADYEYYAKPGRDFSFLPEESTKENNRKRKHADRQAEDCTAQYEKLPRRMASQSENVKPLLPIKSSEGSIIPRMQNDVIDAGEHEENGQEMEDSSTPQEIQAPPEPLPAVSTAQLFHRRQTKLAECKQRIATLANSILEQPEEGAKKLKELRAFLEESDADVFLTVRKLAMLSLLEIFKDIIPGYKIRVATDAEKSQAAKKETKKIRDFEEALINNYRHYLEYLEFVLKGKNDKSVNGKRKSRVEYKYDGLIIPTEAKRGMKETSLRCLCELLVTHPHFNYRTNIISLVVPYAADGNQQMSELVCSYIKQIFRQDKSREVTLEIVRLIGRIIKTKNFNIKPKILETFLTLKIKAVIKDATENKADRRRKLKAMSRKEKKRHKQMKELEKELEDASMEKNVEQKLKLNTEIVNMIFLTYFRILKLGQKSVLLSTVLEGLAKFAHLINIDFFNDLFAVITDLVDSGELTYRESLHCVQTAFTILSGQGSALNIDPIRFYTHLYKSTLQLHAGVTSDDVVLVFRCMDVMINKRRKQVSQQRLLAFLKRLTTLALQFTSDSALGALATARSFINTFPQSDLLLDTDAQGSGFFLPELDEPEHCNAHNTALYELHLLNRSYHPVVRRYASHVLHGAPTQGHSALPLELARKQALELCSEFSSSQMLFNPPVESKPKGKGKHKKFSTEDFVQKELENRLSAAHSTSCDFTQLDFYQSVSPANSCDNVPVKTANHNHSK